MPIAFTVDPEARLVTAAVTPPPPTAAEFRDFLDAVLAHPDHRPGFGLLHDRRAVREPATPDYIRAAAAAVRDRAGRLGRFRWAVLVPDLAGYGMSRMGGFLADRQADILPFFDEAEARAWLAAGHTS